MDIKYLILGAIGLLSLFAIIIIIIKWKKGSIEIIPEKKDYQAGDVIKGKIILILREPVKKGRIFMGLKCKRIERTYSNDKKNNIENEDVLFDFNQPVDNEKEYPPGEYSYDFSLTVPLNIHKREKLIIEVSDKDKSVNVLPVKQPPLIKWNLYCRLDCESAGLSNDVQMNIL
jgi:hypothetical protein